MKILSGVIFVSLVCFGAMAALLSKPSSEFVGSPPETNLTGATHGRLESENSVHASVSESLSKKQHPESEQGIENLLSNHRALGRMGDYTGAIRALTSLMQQHPGRTELQAELAELLFASALVDADRKDYSTAIGKLRRSAQLNHPHASAKLAQLLILTGERNEALVHLHERADQSNDLFSLEAMTDLYLSMEQLEPAAEALSAYTHLRNRFEQKNKIETLTPEEERIAQRMDSFLKEREAKLHLKKKMQESSFLINRSGIEVRYFSADVESLAYEAIQWLAEVSEELAVLFGPAPAGAALRVWLVEREGFQAATGAPPWAGALFDGIMRIPFDTASLKNSHSASMMMRMTRRLIRHEATHAYLYNVCGNRIPSWIGEGLAQTLEDKNPEAARTILQQDRGNKWKKMPEGESLEKHFLSYKDPNIVRTLYLRSLILVNELSKGQPELWRSFLSQTCTNELPYHEALEAITGHRNADALWNATF